jgi:plastocyanin
MKLMSVALVAAFASGSVVAFAAEKSISQKNRQFSESAVTVKKGETLVFVNDDNIAHNIMSTSAGNEFNLGSQSPGASSPLTLNSAGEVTVLCAIHPRMKMTVTVTE